MPVFRMHGIDKQYDGSVIVRVDNDGSTRISGMAIGVRAEQVPVVGGICCEAVPAESASQAGSGAWHGTHGFYAQRAQDAAAVPFASVLQGCAEHGNIFGTGEYSGVAADASVHDTCQRVVYLSVEDLPVRLFFGWRDGIVPVSFGDTCPVCVRCIYPFAILVTLAGQIVGMLHAEYIEYVFTGKVTQALAAYCLDDMLQGDEVEATVLEICLWLEVAFASSDILYETIGIGRTVLLF